MDVVAIILSALVGSAVGTVWYRSFRQQWRLASGVPCDRRGAPRNARDTLPYFLAFLTMLLTAIVLHELVALTPIHGPWQGALTGALLGLFLVTPWMAMSYTHAMRAWRLILIDGGYAVLGPTVIGFVLGLF
ncbi:DUF1761 domain-containing protein [Pseudooceanicola sp. CBS1P-1]|uniref:DUF1761 family protein n=1 Tax=Pseudooceanicola albus TaxID=2692189 RepID=A0A6L7G8K2_9RHOB|nr:MULTISPECIES: DUF1761 domain-containing protein [Pseudooceanicola]MBT9385750.1 DUF1761 domain-containing protein [Pseudooceanicola endophyticus]MXN19982.1 DUF1761 family protein [Pseudooceanicola albus]